jgi:hypothetical protein
LVKCSKLWAMKDLEMNKTLPKYAQHGNYRECATNRGHAKYDCVSSAQTTLFMNTEKRFRLDMKTNTQ